MSVSSRNSNHELVSPRVFWALLACGLVLRLAILWGASGVGVRIVDEQHYAQLASNVLAGHGFGWGPGDLTSIRPPLYPGLLVAIWSVFGDQNFQAVRVVQMGLAMATTAGVYALGLRAFNPSVARFGAVLCWLYPSLVFFNALILTETLFALLLVAFLLAAVALVQSPRPANAVLCGAALALAALTRSVLWPVPLLLCPLFGFLITAPLRHRIALPLLVLASYIAVVAPWAVRNTRVQGVLTIVDTMGGMNLRMGNYEHTPDDRMWDAVSLTGEQSWIAGFSVEPGQVPTEGRKDKWGQQKAIEYILEHPGTTIRRSFIKFADFWSLEREFIAGVQAGLYSPPLWLAVAGSGFILGGYVLILILAAGGAWLAPPQDWRVHVLMLFPVVVLAGAHTLVFGHSRYHVPLMPILGLYAAHLLMRLPRLRPFPRLALVGASSTIAIAVTIWARQVLIVDLPRITAFLDRIG